MVRAGGASPLIFRPTHDSYPLLLLSFSWLTHDIHFPRFEQVPRGGTDAHAGPARHDVRCGLRGIRGGYAWTARARLRGRFCRAGPRHHACPVGRDIGHEGARNRRGRTSCVREPLTSQVDGWPAGDDAPAGIVLSELMIQTPQNTLEVREMMDLLCSWVHLSAFCFDLFCFRELFGEALRLLRPAKGSYTCRQTSDA